MWSTFNRQLPGLLIFLTAAAVVLGLVSGRLRLEWNSGRVAVSVTLGRPRTLLLPLQFAEGWTVLALVLLVLWASAEAIVRSEWMSGLTALVSLAALGGVCGFLLAKSRLNALAFTLAGLEAGFLTIVWVTHGMAAGGTTPHPLWQFWWPVQPWLAEFWRSTTWGAQMGLLAIAWITGLWTAWWVFRRQRGLVALLPSGAVIAVDVLNDPTHSVLSFLVAIWLAAGVSLLLRLHYVGLARRWRERRIPRAADTGWNFGEIGFEATSALLVLSFLIPPLNQQDLSSVFVPSDLSFANFGRSLGLGTSGGGRGGTINTGFALNVRPWGPIRRSSQPVFEATGLDTADALYWEGIALGAFDGQEWTALSAADGVAVGLESPHAAGRSIPLLESEVLLSGQRALSVTFTVRQAGLGTIFGGGMLRKVEGSPTAVRGLTPDLAIGARPAADTAPVNGRFPRAAFATVDQVTVPPHTRLPSKYTTSSLASVADVQSLRAAGTTYPGWIKPFTKVYNHGGPHNEFQRQADAAIARLARQVVAAAGATNVYEQATAIEAYLRRTDGASEGPASARPFTYDLETPSPPGDQRAVDYFLLRTHRGYCEYFASSMGVMLRTLGIPARLVNGFGKGSYDPQRGFVVRAQDAHTWVEVYFPGYGWVPFEPTPDPNYPLIDRPSTPPGGASGPEGTAAGGAGVTRESEREPDEGVGDQGAGGAAIGAARQLSLPALILLLLTLAAFLALQLYLRVGDARRIWRRLMVLGARYRVPARPSDTPLEFGERLAVAVPTVGISVRSLAALYTRACFRKDGLSAPESQELQTAWNQVRRRYLSLLWRSLRPPQTAEI